MRIATWNVNSIKARFPTVLEVLQAIDCDVVCLQELKCETDAFPYMELEEAGWHCEVHGQKSYNGVAILSKHPLEDVVRGLPGNADDDQARYIEAAVSGVIVASLYAPNGNPQPGPKFDAKLAWTERLVAHAGAPCPPEVSAEARRRFGDEAVWEGPSVMSITPGSATSRGGPWPCR